MNNIFGLLQALQTNPMSIISKRFNFPQNMTDPQQIVNHLLKTGQVSQQQVNQAMQMRSNPIFKNMFK